MGTKKFFTSYILLSLFILLISSPTGAGEVTITSIRELATHAQKNGNEIRMEPGIYEMSDYISPEDIDDRRDSKTYPFLNFTGHGNTFDLRGVTIRFNTVLREKLNPPIHTPEFVVSGQNNELRGLSIINIGEGTSNGGNVMTLSGDKTVLRDCTFVVRGSSPYGYGDLLGFGGKQHQRLWVQNGEKALNVDKHSGIRITGDDNKIVNCSVYMRSLGHAFYLQEHPNNTLFKNCYVEGKMRSTNDMLDETSGPAYDNDFRAIEARGGRIKPGYIKSLSEDAFRIYSAGNVTMFNCKAKNMRKGFAVTRGGPHI